MKLLYDNSGYIHYAVYDKDVFTFTHTTNVPLTEYEIEEIELNKTLCLDIHTHVSRRIHNAAGEGKYYMEGGALFERDGFIPVEENP